jgi:hypothetical protein|tara:strand:+ start:962 stop:2038 length:1077 start_codon:yes stop_codon:yes gene_type:complete
MGKFWKEAIGGQVQTGVYQASPRHASKQYGSFKTGRPPRLPFQFVVYFEINPLVAANNTDKYQYSSLVRAIDLPSVTFTVDKKNAYNKMRPVLTTKDFKPFTLSVYDDIESRWYALWQHYYNYHFMDGRFDQKAGKDLSVANRNAENHQGMEFSGLTDAEIGTSASAYNHNYNGIDVHSAAMTNYFTAIHIFQIHANTITRTTAVNPVLTDAQVTQLDYASSGVPSEILFNIDYEKLAYGPVLNYDYEKDAILKELIEDVTKAPVFDPAQDKLKGLVKGMFGLEQSNIGQAQNPMHDLSRDIAGTESDDISLRRVGNESTQGGFFSNLLRNALDTKIDQATDSLFKKNNKNINKLNFF